MVYNVKRCKVCSLKLQFKNLSKSIKKKNVQCIFLDMMERWSFNHTCQMVQTYPSIILFYGLYALSVFCLK